VANNKYLEKIKCSVLENSIAGHILVDAKTGVCLYVNGTAKTTLEVTEDSSDVKIDTFFSVSSRAEIIGFGAEQLTKEAQYTMLSFKRMSGRLVYCRAQVTLHENNTVHVCFVDITEELKLNREITVKQKELLTVYNEMVQQNSELKQLDKAKDKFISLTSHELRTPLSACIATAEVLHLKLYSDEEELADYIKTIYDQSKYLLEIVNDILDFSKIQSGKMELFIEEQDIYDLLESTINEFEGVAKKKNIQISYAPDKATAVCYFDSIRMKQVVFNLMSNAVKFSKENSTVSVSSLEEDDFIHIRVEDKGIGIAEEDFEKIFNEFETLEKINRHEKGTGLGLPITKKLLEFMGGKISVASVLGEGSVFIFSIPKNKILEEHNYRSRESLDYDLIKAG
jgi:signal transduction histidine kinase